MTDSRPQFDRLGQALLRSEHDAVTELLQIYQPTPDVAEAITEQAGRLVSNCRARRKDSPLVDQFLQQYGLSSEEGVAILCMVEALLRIPDPRTAENLIAEKLSDGNWETHLGQSESLLVNASTWGFILTGAVVDLGRRSEQDPLQWAKGVLSHMKDDLVRRAMLAAMNILSRSFVAGQTIEEAVKRADEPSSFDMLGEGARTYPIADEYYKSYQTAIQHLAVQSSDPQPFEHGLSLKLTALYPKIHPLNEEEAVESLFPLVEQLCILAAAANLQVTIDGEESDRCEIGLRVIERLLQSPQLKGWTGLGVVVQTYAKRAVQLIDWLDEVVRQHRTRINVRVVKGAYWDTEVKLAQVNGLPEYPVFTRKENTDLSYLASAYRLLQHADHLYPQFATHNAHTIIAVKQMAGLRRYEYQRLHGMGKLLYEEAIKLFECPPLVRVYAPVGRNEDLIPYLMRRLLENGANTSFVNRIMDAAISVADVVADPIQKVQHNNDHSHPKIPLPINLYGHTRSNSFGVDFGTTSAREAFRGEVGKFSNTQWDFTENRTATKAFNPAKTKELVGTYGACDGNSIDERVQALGAATGEWAQLDPKDRARRIDRWADLIVEHRAELCSMLQREAGKTIEDAVTELREAEDFCRFYAAEARTLLTPIELPSPTGETNYLMFCPRGTFVCISPWNFPAAIFVGPIAAALVAGNAVAAKPAPQTSLVALRLAQLAYSADIPRDVFCVFPGGDEIGKALVANPSIAGVAFTGSQFAARSIAQSLASQEGAIKPLIAETGGVNVMIVDSTAQLEHVVDDIVFSAFMSVGQRCSALRLLCVQDELADQLFEMLKGAIDTLEVGNPSDWSTDLGPVIDDEAKTILVNAINEYRVLHSHRGDVPNNGYFVVPTVVEVNDLKSFNTEHFGPILGLYRYHRNATKDLVEEINSLGFGLTFGIHSRLNRTIDYFTQNLRVGNMYVNRTITGAVVGTQPFGGEGLSGTGPKTGGPLYLQRYVVERVVTRNETATGGNLTLMRL